MQLWTDLINPAELTEFAREIQENLPPDPLASVFPSAYVDDVVFGWNVNESLDDVAEFRAFNAETPIGSGKPAQRKTAELAPLGKKYIFTEYEQLRRRGSASPETVQAAAERRAVAAVQAIEKRITQLRGSALVTGALTINENRFVQSVPFGRKSAHTNAAPAALWSATSGVDAVADLVKWAGMIDTETGGAPDFLAMTTVGFTALAKDIGDKYVTTASGIVSRDAVNEVLAGYGLPPVTIDNRQIAGTKVIPDTHVVLARSGGAAGGTVWGISADADEPNYAAGGTTAGPGIVVGAYKTEDPNTKWIRSDAVALPILSVPDATLSAKVFA